MAKKPGKSPEKKPETPLPPSPPVDPLAEPSPVTASPGRYYSLGCVLASKSAAEKGVTHGKLATLAGVSRPLVALALKGSRPANQQLREVCKEHLGVPLDAWGKPPPSGATSSAPAARAPVASASSPSDPSPGTSSGEAPPPPAASDDLDPLEKAKEVLRDIETQLRGELCHADRTKYLAQKTATAKLVAQLTGELDQTDLQKFRRTIEYQDLTRRVIRALQPYPEASAAVIRELGHAVEVVGKAAAASQLGLAELREHCGYAEHYVSTDDLCPAIDALVYPVADRERELVQADIALAKRIVDVIEKTDAVIRSSKVSYPPSNDYRAKVLDRLKVEVAREDLFVAFERDFGRVACERARALG